MRLARRRDGFSVLLRGATEGERLAGSSERERDRLFSARCLPRLVIPQDKARLLADVAEREAREERSDDAKYAIAYQGDYVKECPPSSGKHNL